MEDENGVVHPGVQLLLARMDSHPEEFVTDTRWARHYQIYKTHWNAHEKRLFSDKLRAIRMQVMHEHLMKELLT